MSFSRLSESQFSMWLKGCVGRCVDHDLFLFYSNFYHFTDNIPSPDILTLTKRRVCGDMAIIVTEYCLSLCKKFLISEISFLLSHGTIMAGDSIFRVLLQPVSREFYGKFQVHVTLTS